MIRINLANALMRSMDSVAKPAVIAVSADSKMMRENVIKAALILIPLVGLFIYERTNLSSKQQVLDAIVAEKQTLDAKLAQVGTVDDVLRQIEQQKQEVDRKVEVVRKIFSMRRQKLNSILTLQTHIPRSSWLRVLEFNADTIKINGTASNTEDAQNYASLLSQEKDLFLELTNKGINKVETVTNDVKVESFQFEYIGKIKE